MWLNMCNVLCGEISQSCANPQKARLIRAFLLALCAFWEYNVNDFVFVWVKIWKKTKPHNLIRWRLLGKSARRLWVKMPLPL